MAIKCTCAYRRMWFSHPREGGDLLLYSVPAPFQKNVKVYVCKLKFYKNM